MLSFRSPNHLLSDRVNKRKYTNHQSTISGVRLVVGPTRRAEGVALQHFSRVWSRYIWTWMRLAVWSS
jgi:hypothetical protein